MFSRPTLLGLVVLLLSATHVQDQPRSLTVEAIEFSLPTVNLVELRAQYNIDLHNTLIKAVEGGLVLGFIAELRIVKEYPFWTNRDIHHFVWHASIEKLPAGEGFRFQRFGVDQSHTVSSLAEALDKINLLHAQFPDPEIAALLCSTSGLTLARVEINLKNLPDALQVGLLTSHDWDFSSGWQPSRHVLQDC